ncbi:MAG: hypothetical protein AAGC76_06830 [Luteibacter sp.]|uniref:hypothetical protein n=1 Tax=Luteibacter TaxID=242605 RepID=UPI000561366F|nr:MULTISPECIES: hypothetical protein [unclassified Luteibacter]MDQ7995550.1 hypothetical protein [Luteibacter sp.]MDQ8047638.1 hypothetical protein [Luteibacter sp.]
MNESLIACPAVLALELAGGEMPDRLELTRDEAQTLAALVADDLRALLPGVEASRFALAGALFDGVELLRPGFPVLATLEELARRVPRVVTAGGVIAFGTHEGHMPAQPLVPDPHFAGGPMRLIPWMLLVPADQVEDLSQAMERELAAKGEAGTATSDFLMRTLGMRLEHARYLTRDDLLALTCVQYEHVNLAPLWTMLEAALLTPYKDETALGSRGLPLRYTEGRVEIPGLAAWFARDANKGSNAAHELAGTLFELRQYAALLAAHHVHLVMQDMPATEGFLIETMADADPSAAAPRIYAHEAAGLGMAAITIAQPVPGKARVLAHGFPLAPDALTPLLQTLADRYGTDSEVHTLGRIMLDADGALTAPAPALH